jgi:hypothetical protein
MRAALALALLVGCGGSKAAPPPRTPAPAPVAEATAPAEAAPPAGWIPFEHELWRGHVPSVPDVREQHDAGPAVRREVVAKGTLPEGAWLVGNYEFDPAALVNVDPYVMLEASRNGLLSSTGMGLDTERRASVAIDATTCPALHFRSHSDEVGAAVTMALCGSRMVHIAWVIYADLAPTAVDPAKVEARRDLLLANVHLRD